MKAKAIKFAVGFAVCAIGIAGCDVAEQILPKPTANKEVEAERKRAEERQQQELKDQAATNLAVLKSKGKALIATASEALAKVKNLVAEDEANSVALSKVVDEVAARQVDGKSLRRYDVLCELLGNAKVRELARLYMGKDLALIKMKLVDEYEKEGAIHREKRALLMQNASAEEEAKKLATQGMAVPMAGKHAAVERLRREIIAAENEYDKAKRDLETTSSARSASEVRFNKQRHLDSIRSRLSILRGQYDSMKLAKTANMETERAQRSAALAIGDAKRQRERADLQVEKRFGNLKSASEILTAYEQQTIAALRIAINEAKVRKQGKLDQLAADITYFKSVIEAATADDAQAVRKFIEEIDNRLKKGFVID